jgi:LemA protein
MSVITVVVAIVVAVVVWCVLTTNNFKKLDIRVSESLSGIEVALKKRYDLLNKMVDTTKSYVNYESSVLEKIVNLRNNMTPGELAEADAEVTRLRNSIFAVAENYPQLRSNEVVQQLQASIQDSEDHLQAARRVYNTSVTAYNTAIQMFPASLLAGGRQSKEFYRVEQQAEREDVKISF